MVKLWTKRFTKFSDEIAKHNVRSFSKKKKREMRKEGNKRKLICLSTDLERPAPAKITSLQCNARAISG